MKLSFVIPTRNRGIRLRATLRSLAIQRTPPDEVVIVDASDDREEVARIEGEFALHFSRLIAACATQRGAAAQRNQGVALATGDLIGFCDDDIDFEPNCVFLLREHFADHPEYGGVSATITNQSPRGFGRATRAVLWCLAGKRGLIPDGRLIGPALNFLPRLLDQRHEAWNVDWLNLGCTLYQKKFLPMPPFDAAFVGYSMLEDVTLSFRVGRKAKLAVLPQARVFHDSQPSSFKSNLSALAKMGVRNRFYVATRVIGRPASTTLFQLALWQSFCAVAGLRKINASWFRENWAAAVALGGLVLGRKCDE